MMSSTKKNWWLAFVLASAWVLAEAKEGSVSIGSGAKPRDVVVEIKNGTITCGMEIRFGDGREEKKRLTEGEVWRVSHTYAADGNFGIEAAGVFILRGLRTAGPCSYSNAALLAVAGANASLRDGNSAAPNTVAAREPQAAQPNQATPVQSAPQDLLILVRKNDSGNHLKFVKTLDGSRRLDSTQGSLTTSACVVGFPDPSGRMADANVEAAARAELRRYLAQLANIKDVHVGVNYFPCSRGSGNEFHFGSAPNLVLIQSQSVDLLKRLYGYDHYEQLHKISYASLVAVAGEMRSAENQRKEVLDRRAQELDALAQSGSTEKVGSLAFFTPHSPGRGVTFCTLSYDGEKGAAVLGYGYRGIATQAEAFRAEAERVRATVNTSRPYGKVYATADALYEELLSQQECMVYVDFPANLKKLSAALQRDGLRAPVLGELVSSMELKDGWAQRTGYQNYAEYQIAREMNVNVQQFKQLAEYRVADKSSLDAVMRQMQVSGYSNSSEVSDALRFLQDKAEAAGRGGATALSVRDARQKAERETSAAEAAAEQRRREAVAKDFPYIAVLTCGMPRHVNIMGCFAGGSRGVSTELKLRNGTETTLFKTYNLHQAGKERPDGFYIDLRRNFDLRAQNADENLILGLKIIDRVSGRVLTNDQAARFDVVSARN